MSRPFLIRILLVLTWLTLGLVVARMLGATFSWRVFGLRIRLNDISNALTAGVICGAAAVALGSETPRARLSAVVALSLFAALGLAAIARDAQPYTPQGDIAIIESDTFEAVHGRMLLGP